MFKRLFSMGVLLGLVWLVANMKGRWQEVSEHVTSQPAWSEVEADTEKLTESMQRVARESLKEFLGEEDLP